MNIITSLPPIYAIGIAGVIALIAVILIIKYNLSIWLPEMVREFMRQPRAIFVTTVNNVPRLAGRVWLKKGLKEYKKGDSAYLLDPEKCIFSAWGNPIWFFEIGKAVPIPFGKLDEKLKDSTKIMKTTIDTKVFRDYLGPAQDTKYLIVIGLLVIAVIGVGAYGQYLLGHQNAQILDLTKKLAELAKNVTPGSGVIIK